MNMKVIQRRKVQMARKPRLLSRIPAQPTTLVKRPRAAARVERTSSERLPTRTMSAWSQMSNQVRRQKMRVTRE